MSDKKAGVDWRFYMQLPKCNSLYEYWNCRQMGVKKESLIWLSDSKKILYLKSPKCASTSIARKLIQEIKDIRNLRTYSDPPEFDKYYKFCFVRNPWDRFVSLYHNYYDTKKLGRKSTSQKISFNEFILSQHYLTNQILALHAMPIIELTSFNGTQQMDFIGRVETIHKDFAKLNKYIGGKLQILNKTSNRKHYSTYYTEETKQIIADLYHKDIEAFGYKFELEK